MFDGLAENFFALAIGVDIGGVEEVAAGLHADVDEMASAFGLGVAPRGEEVVAGAEGAGAEAEFRDFEAGAAECAVFHKDLAGLLVGRARWWVGCGALCGGLERFR